MSAADRVASVIEAAAAQRERLELEEQDHRAREDAFENWAGRIRDAASVKVEGRDLPDLDDLTKRLLELGRAFGEPTWWTGRPGGDDAHSPDIGVLTRLNRACGHPEVPPEFRLIASLLILSATEPGRVQPLLTELRKQVPDLLARGLRWLSWVCHVLVLAQCPPGSRYGAEACSSDVCPVPSTHEATAIRAALWNMEQKRPEALRHGSAGNGFYIAEQSGPVRRLSSPDQTPAAGAVPAAATEHIPTNARQPSVTDEGSALGSLAFTPLAVKDLLKAAGLPDDEKTAERLRKRLEEFRRSKPTCYVEVQGRQKNAPRFLYFPASVRPVLEDLAKSLGSPPHLRRENS